MDLTRFTRIIEAYGSQPARWPVEERAAASQFAAEYSTARQLLNEHSQLDRYLQEVNLATHEHLNLSQLEANLLAQVATLEQQTTIKQQTAHAGLPATMADSLDHFIAWLLPTQQQPTIIWRPTLLAALPLIAGLLIGSNLQLDNLDDTATWEEEVYLLALVPDAMETQP